MNQMFLSRNRPLALLVILAATAALAAQTGKSAQDESTSLVGDWRGDSICQVHPSACKDEKALYRFTKLGDRPNHFSVEADKIVNGEAVQMGTIECSFAPEKHAVSCSTPKFTVQLTLNGKSLTGTMNLPDGTLWRNITLRHD
ncbi:MAG TPA: hypothetical protein VFR24_09015 [Candidatus Angelobacter sp.]|nr:hypothetical protein [Candidatus Angelobacter sp.]